MTDCTNPKTSDGVVVGTCCCGGYGVVLHEEAAEEAGRCHVPLEEVCTDRTEPLPPHAVDDIPPPPFHETKLDWGIWHTHYEEWWDAHCDPDDAPSYARDDRSQLSVLARRLARGRIEQIYLLRPRVRAKAAEIIRGWLDRAGADGMYEND